jgi:hypothetical protein
MDYYLKNLMQFIIIGLQNEFLIAIKLKFYFYLIFGL